MVSSSVVLWVLAAAGLAILVSSRLRDRRSVFLIGLAVFSSLAIIPGLSFRPHYFVLLPAVALLSGAALARLSAWLGARTVASVGNAVAAAILVIGLAISIWRQSGYLLQWDLPHAVLSLYPESPFIEATVIGEYVREHSRPDDRSAVLGSEPEIYFYAQRRSATGYIYVYSLMEDQPFAAKMQREMIREIEEAKPQYIVFVAAAYSWLRHPESPSTIIEWALRYLDAYYVQCALLEDVGSLESRAYIGKQTYGAEEGGLAAHHCGKEQKLAWGDRNRRTMFCRHREQP